MDINVKIKMTRNMPAPEYATDGAAAMDLRAALDEGESVVLEPGERALIPTGVHISPERKDVVAIVAARSGLGIKHGISLSNGIGVIDSDYRGEIIVCLHNHSEEAVTVENGERVAQMVFAPYFSATFTESEELSGTERGAGGFGSTGAK